MRRNSILQDQESTGYSGHWHRPFGVDWLPAKCRPNSPKMTDRDLAKLLTLLAAFASGRVMRASAQALAAPVNAELARAFSEHQSPDGRVWPRRRGPSAHPLLDDSGRLKRGFVVTVTTDGVKVTNAVPYALAHQRGARRRRRRGARRRTPAVLGRELAARPMVPVGRWGPRPTARLKAVVLSLTRKLAGAPRP